MLNELVLDINYGAVDQWEFFIGIVLNTSLSFLLVFRLNRAAERYWLARESWGNVVANIRHLVSGIDAHGGHDPKNRDCAVSWVAAFPIATMQYMRGITDIPPDMLAGVLDPADVKLLASSLHPPVFAADQVRAALVDLFLVTPDTPSSLAHAWSQQLNTLEKTLNAIMDQEGAMERIRSTPLPLVYVTHLRMFLLVFLFSLPYIWYPSWRWSTIPIVFITSFAMLGLEGAAVEVECPFRRDRPNHLDMDKFCMVAMSAIQQTLCNAVDRDTKKKRSIGGAREAISTDAEGSSNEAVEESKRLKK